MTAVQPGPPETPAEVSAEAPAVPPTGRYGAGDRRFGESADARADRKLKAAAVVLGVLAAAGIGWYGWHTVADGGISAQVVAFKAVSDHAVEIHLEVHKGAGDVAVCTLRSQDTDHNEVGRKDVRLAQHAKEVDTVVTVRTTALGATGELVSCDTAS